MIHVISAGFAAGIMAEVGGVRRRQFSADCLRSLLKRRDLKPWLGRDLTVDIVMDIKQIDWLIRIALLNLIVI